MEYSSARKWVTGTEGERRLESFEMCCYRSMLKTKCCDRMTNEEVGRRMWAERKLWKNVIASLLIMKFKDTGSFTMRGRKHNRRRTRKKKIEGLHW